MSYCRKCGAYIPEGDDACPACGEGVYADAPRSAASGAAAAAAPKAGTGEKKSAGGEYNYKYSYERAKKAEDAAREGPSRWAEEIDDDLRENRSMGYLCYLGPLLLVPLLTKPNSQFLKYHCNQGLLLLLLCIATGAVGGIPVIGWMASVAGSIIALIGFFRGMGNIHDGKRSPLPVIGDITLIK